MMKKPARIVETVFDALYLGAALVIAVLLMLIDTTFGSLQFIFGIMGLVLVFGDSFHLIPRIRAMWDKDNERHSAALGYGKMASSLTMTVFYVGLWYIGITLYEINQFFFSAIIIVLALIRIILCVMPQNKWKLPESDNNNWQLIRNIPFIIICLAVMILFIFGAQSEILGPSYLWVAILISVACYLPVVLFAKTNPKLGMLMLPKSCAYIAILIMGFSFP